jgi:hypothetical protein
MRSPVHYSKDHILKKAKLLSSSTSLYTADISQERLASCLSFVWCSNPFCRTVPEPEENLVLENCELPGPTTATAEVSPTLFSLQHLFVRAVRFYRAYPVLKPATEVD